jgi:RNA polymerase sigma-70 factor (ECF subfamily)
MHPSIPLTPRHYDGVGLALARICAAVVTDPRQEIAADCELARRAASGDASSRRAIAERLIDRVHTTLAYLAPTHPDRDDLVQRSLIEILKSVGSYRGDSALETWADKIVTRTAMRLIHQRARQAEIVALVPDPEPTEAPDGAPEEDAASRSQMRLRLQALLSRLSPERRTAVVLRFVHGYSIAEIAESTGAPVNTVRDRLRVGKALLRKYILKDPVLGPSDDEG